MAFLGHAFVDWDDTVAEGIRYFHEVEIEVSRRIGALTGAEPQAVRTRGGEIDVAVSRRIGLVKESFGMAWAECYREFCAGAGLAPDAAVEAEIVTACQRPYHTHQDLLPGAVEVLQWLHGAGFEVTIWTAGDDAVQKRKVRQAGVDHLLHRLTVVPSKSPEALRSAMAERSVARSFVLGNSLHSDIQPALTLGMLALHVPAETWAYDHSPIDTATPAYQRLDHISQAPPLLAQRFKLAV